jgi:hypothetical protein
MRDNTAKKDIAEEISKKELLAQISSLAKELQRFTSVDLQAKDGTTSVCHLACWNA